MKLAPVLAQYLYAHKRLILPGIGMFQSDPSVYFETANGKNSKDLPTDTISFQSDPSVKPDEELIKFISSHTGKMRALAMSDLESYIELMKQFLNIGKPFQLEGIGTLTKIRSLEYAFTQGVLLNERITEPEENYTDSSTNADESTTVSFRDLYKKHDNKAGLTLKKAAIAFLFLGGIGFAIWGGYALYSKNQSVATPVNEAPPATQIVPVEDTVKYTEKKKIDTIAKPAEKSPPGYKFVFESTPNKNKAIKRFNFLKNINSDIHLETTDSNLFKITVDLNIPSADTLRIKDSLNAWYYGSKDILVKIESKTNSTQNVQ